MVNETGAVNIQQQSILDRIVASTRTRVERKKTALPFPELIRKVQQANRPDGFAFEEVLKEDGLKFICEIKRASPSKGIIASEFRYVEIAKEYEQAGADAISVLTEPYFFHGSEDHLAEIRRQVTVPILRKDFIVDPYQLCESKLLGASAVLLICSVIERTALKEYISVCDELGLSALVEAHNEAEVENALKAGARIIGVNNRNLRDFTVDLNNSIALRKLVPENILFVAESGICNEKDIATLKVAGVNAVLIGEALMRSSDKAGMLKKLRGDVR